MKAKIIQFTPKNGMVPIKKQEEVDGALWMFAPMFAWSFGAIILILFLKGVHLDIHSVVVTHTILAGIIGAYGLYRYNKWWKQR